MEALAILRKATEDVCHCLNTTSWTEMGKTRDGRHIWDELAKLHKEMFNVVTSLEHSGSSSLSGLAPLSLPVRKESEEPHAGFTALSPLK